MKAIEPDKSPEDTPKVEVLAGLYRALEDVKAGRVSPVEELWEDDLDNLADTSHLENLSPNRHTQALKATIVEVTKTKWEENLPVKAIVTYLDKFSETADKGA